MNESNNENIGNETAKDQPPDQKETIVLKGPSLLSDILTPELSQELARTRPEGKGDWIGGFQLQEILGEGGFGIVWMAQQESPVKRQVALKIIKPGMDTKEVLARFEQERQALAILDHPNIAKVIDAGATQWGRPYFVMELVRGLPLTAYCDEAHLPVMERVRLFMGVCHAVQHAHQKGIIHRDLKPSNILVSVHDGLPLPKVIDFGVAKATENRLTELTLQTQLEQMIGTPLYMSPEQAGGELDIDTRSDIYSLGVILYELITGRTPFDPKDLFKRGMDEMRRIIREDDPPRPSTALGAMEANTRTVVVNQRKTQLPTLVGLLRGDLDWVVMKALEKNRVRRYESANALADDLSRHLRSEPVIARPPSAGYRFRRMLRRNKLAFAAGAAVLTSMFAGTGVSIWQAVSATHARDEARLQKDKAVAAREQAEEILEYLLDDLPNELGGKAQFPVFEKIEKKVEDYYEKLGVDQSNPAQMRRRAWAHSKKGDTRQTAGDISEATTAYGKALDIMKQIASREPENLARQRDLAIAYGNLGSILEKQGKTAAAMENYLQYEGIMARLAKIDPSNEDWQHEYAGSSYMLADALLKRGDLVGAAKAHDIALEIRLRWSELNPRDSGWAMELSDSHLAIGRLRKEQGNFDESVKLMGQALGRLEAIVKSNSDNANLAERLASGYIELGEVLVAREWYPLAEEAVSKAAEIAERIGTADPANKSLQRKIGTVQRKLATVREAKGNLTGAEESLVKAVENRAQAVIADPGNAILQRNHSVALRELGRVRRMNGKLAEAAEVTENALEILTRIAEPDPDNRDLQRGLFLVHTQLGVIRTEQGDLSTAESLQKKAFACITSLVERDPENSEYQMDLASLHGNIARLRRGQMDKPGEEKEWMKALDIVKMLEARGSSTPELVKFSQMIGQKLEALRQK